MWNGRNLHASILRLRLHHPGQEGITARSIMKHVWKKLTHFIRSAPSPNFRGFMALIGRYDLARELSELQKHHENVVAERNRLVALAQAQVVRLAFRLALTRDPSLEEENYYVGLLNSGESSDSLLEKLANSAEGQALKKQDRG